MNNIDYIASYDNIPSVNKLIDYRLLMFFRLLMQNMRRSSVQPLHLMSFYDRPNDSVVVRCDALLTQQLQLPFFDTLVTTDKKSILNHTVKLSSRWFSQVNGPTKQMRNRVYSKTFMCAG